jgi:hypothetical protein
MQVPSSLGNRSRGISAKASLPARLAPEVKTYLFCFLYFRLIRGRGAG